MYNVKRFVKNAFIDNVSEIRNCTQKTLTTNFAWSKFQHHCFVQNRVLWLYVLDCNVLFCKMPSFGQACSMTIPMNINLLWKITLDTIPCLKCSRERIRIAIALRKTAKPETKFLQFAVTGEWMLARVIFHSINNNKIC